MSPFLKEPLKCLTAVSFGLTRTPAEMHWSKRATVQASEGEEGFGGGGLNRVPEGRRHAGVVHTAAREHNTQNLTVIV